MLDRVRNWVGIGESAAVPGGHRTLTRRERELRQRRVLYVLTAIAAAAVALTLIVGAIYQYIIVPRETYATVNGVDIRREDYEKRRTYDLLQEITSLSQQMQQMQQGQQGQQGQQQQIQQALELAQIELQDLDNNDKNIDPESLKLMVEDQLILQSLDDFGIALSDDEVDDFVDQILAPVPLETPTETPTVHPTAEAWATQTFEEQVDAVTATAEAQETAQAQEPTEDEENGDQTEDDAGATGTPAEETDDEEADATGTPEADVTEEEAEETEPGDEEDLEDLEDLATIDPDEEDVEPTATLGREDALSTARANFDLLEDNFLERSEMSRSDFKRLVARPALARQRVQEILQGDVEAEAEQVRASHILVSTEDAARELLDGRLQDEEFESVASDVSIDSGTVDAGGDLGWFPRGVMTDGFEEAAFDLDVDEMTEEPVQTEFGWHIILVTDREEERPLTVNMLGALRQTVLDNWLEEQFDEADISSEVPLPEDEPPPAGLGAPGQGIPGQGIP